MAQTDCSYNLTAPPLLLTTGDKDAEARKHSSQQEAAVKPEQSRSALLTGSFISNSRHHPAS